SERVGHRRVRDRSIGDEIIERARRIPVRAPASIDRRDGDGIERCRGTSAEIENARSLAMPIEVEVRGDDIVDVDEVTSLLTIAITTAGREQSHAPLRAVLVEEMISNRCHAALVRLARTVHVEIAETDDL